MQQYAATFMQNLFCNCLLEQLAGAADQIVIVKLLSVVLPAVGGADADQNLISKRTCCDEHL